MQGCTEGSVLCMENLIGIKRNVQTISAGNKPEQDCYCHANYA